MKGNKYGRFSSKYNESIEGASGLRKNGLYNPVVGVVNQLIERKIKNPQRPFEIDSLITLTSSLRSKGFSINCSISVDSYS